MCEIGNRGNHRSKTPGGPLAAKERAGCTARPASGRLASVTSRTRPSALRISGGGGFLRGRRLLTRGAVAARPRELPARARRPPWLCRERSAPARAGKRARHEAPPSPRVGGGAGDVGSGKSPPPRSAGPSAPPPAPAAASWQGDSRTLVTGARRFGGGKV